MPLDREAPNFASPQSHLNALVEEFYRRKREEARQELQELLQTKIETLEAEYKSPKQKRSKKFQTPLGTICLTRKAYLKQGHYVCKADKVLGLPENGWFSYPEKLACVLGVTTEFAHASELLQEITGIQISDHGLANRVEQIGDEAYELLKASPTEEVYPLDSALHQTVCRGKGFRPNLYVGVDGILTPIQHEGYKEAKVGVVFWEHSLSRKRNEIRRKNYVATLASRAEFAELVFKRYAEIARPRPCQTIVLGDGAKWIWEMAEEYYPNAIQILDFYSIFAAFHHSLS